MAKSQSARSRLQKQSSTSKQKTHLQFIPLLVFAVVSWSFIWWMLQSVRPAQIADWPLHSSYFALLVACFTANFFTWTFIFLNARRGTLISLWLTLLALLWLQAVVFSPLLFLTTVAPFLITDVIISMAFLK